MGDSKFNIDIGLLFDGDGKASSNLKTTLDRVGKSQKVKLDLDFDKANLSGLDEVIKKMQEIGNTTILDSNKFPEKIITRYKDEVGQLIDVVRKYNKEQGQMTIDSYKVVNATEKEIDAIVKLQNSMKSKINKLFEGDIIPKDSLLTVEKAVESINALTSKSDIDKINRSISDMINKENEYISAIKQENNERAQAIQQALKQQEAVAKIKTAMQSKLDVASGNELVDESVVARLQTRLDSINTNTAEKEITELKNSINNLSSTDSNIVRLQNAISRYEDSLKSLKGKYDSSLIPTAELSKAEAELSKLVTMMNKLKSSGSGYSTQQISGQINSTASSMRNLTNETKNNSAAMKVASKDAMTFGEALAKAAQNYGLWISAAMIVNKLFTEIRNGVEEVIRLDSAMVDLKKVTDDTNASYSRFLQGAHDTALEVGAQADQVVTAAAQWAKTGKSLEESAVLAKNTMIGVKVGDINVEDMQKYLVAPLKAYNMEAEDSLKIIDAMNNVSNNHAITMQDLGEAYSKASSTMSMAGNSFEEFTAIVTGAQSATQVGGETIGHALVKLGA